MFKQGDLYRNSTVSQQDWSMLSLWIERYLKKFILSGLFYPSLFLFSN